jgi:xanthine/uracil permease
VAAALLLGVVNAVVAVLALAAVELATPDEFGWFAYVPLDDVVVDGPRFPWQYVVVPVALLVVNLVAVTALLRRERRG